MKLFSKSATLDDKIQLTVIALLRLTTFIAVLYLLVIGDLSLSALGLSALLLLFIPDFIERRYKVRLPVEYSFLITLFIYATIVLGWLVDFYDRIWWWDDMLHTSFGVIFGFYGFIFLYILKLKGSIKASNFLLSAFALAVAVMFGVFWEIAEFMIDNIFGTTMQKSLDDTMVDLITDTLGALFSVYFGYRFMQRNKQDNGTFARMVKNLLKENPMFESKK